MRPEWLSWLRFRRLLIDVTLVVVLGGLIWRVAGHFSNGPMSPDWLAAVATWAALVAAVLAGVYAARAYSLELKREHDRDDQQRRTQAEQVAAWYQRPERILVSNRSGLPIFDVRIGAMIPDPVPHEDGSLPESWTSLHRSDIRIPLVVPSEEPTDVSGGVDLDTARALGGWHEWILGTPVGSKPGWPMIEMEFRDAAGRRWIRWGDGRLERSPF